MIHESESRRSRGRIGLMVTVLLQGVSGFAGGIGQAAKLGDSFDTVG